MHFKKFYILSVICLVLTSCFEDISGVESVSAKELKEIILRDSTVQLLDVRLPKEQAQGVILDAKRVNLLSESFVEESVDVLNKEQPVYVYCGSGVRSKVASKLLMDEGYEVYNVKGGYRAWEKVKE